ncbi:MAG TPA: ABC transporter substrate-binding protein, partial [Pararhizobium sp.]|nr:ABC transporter substrate-binding protein [Pararhizobium sp.]
APHWDGAVDKIVDSIAPRGAGQPFALVEDGTIYGRELTENVRVGLEDLGITPAFIDTYRPAQDKQFGLAHRLQRSGATHVFVGGDRSDIAIIARDSAALGLDLTFMGGDSLKAADGDVPLEDGVLAVMTPAPETLPEAQKAITALAARGLPPYGDRIDGYAAAELVAQANKAAEAGGKKLTAVFAAQSFTTALGSIRFDDKHELADNPFELTAWNGNDFVPVGSGAVSKAQ